MKSKHSTTQGGPTERLTNDQCLSLYEEYRVMESAVLEKQPLSTEAQRAEAAGNLNSLRQIWNKVTARRFGFQLVF